MDRYMDVQTDGWTDEVVTTCSPEIFLKALRPLHNGVYSYRKKFSLTSNGLSLKADTHCLSEIGGKTE